MILDSILWIRRNYPIWSAGKYAFYWHHFRVKTTYIPDNGNSVSILTDFEPAQDPLDWIIGIHGLRISFTYHGRQLGATYLPDVPPEQGWTKEETLQSLMRKAGWSGRKAEWHKVQLSVIRYKGTKAHVTYKEYQEMIKFMEDESSGRSAAQETEQNDDNDEEYDSEEYD